MVRHQGKVELAQFLRAWGGELMVCIIWFNGVVRSSRVVEGFRDLRVGMVIGLLLPRTAERIDPQFVFEWESQCCTHSCGNVPAKLTCYIMRRL